MNYWLIIIWTLISAIYSFVRLKLSYWDVKGVKQRNDGILANIRKLTNVHHSNLMQEVYDEFKGKAIIAGTYIYTHPLAVILDLDLVKTVLIKDFHKFSDRLENMPHNDKLSQHLFLANTQLWKSLRGKLTPTFTSGKMKFMFPTIVKVAEEFVLAFEQELERMPDQAIETHDMNARFTTDVIGTCVFGVECNSLKNPNVEFREIGRKSFGGVNYNIKWRLMKRAYMKILSFFGFKRFSTELESFFMRIVNDTVLEREKQNIHRNDFIDILIDLKNQKDEQGKALLDVDLMAAQLFVFFAAGFETSSSNMSYGLYELAKNPEKQEKLRQEITGTIGKHNNQLTYEAMMEMPYLDQVISETLRLHPALAFLQRICMEDYKVPTTDITLEKGTEVFIPAKAIHYDPDIYENPHEFQPERFDASEVTKRHPQAFLGFGDGPRNCIGLRFGRMQVKIGLITLLTKYRFSVCKQTPKELPISDYSFVLVPRDGVWLRADKL